MRRCIRGFRHRVIRRLLMPPTWVARRCYETLFRWQIQNSYSYLPLEGIPTLGSARPSSSLRKYELMRGALAAGDGAAKKPLCVLDLGCNNGYFAMQFARAGHFALGIDASDQVIAAAEFARRRARLSNAAFMCAQVDKAWLERLPSFDVTLLLSVFQKWCAQSGYERALAMLGAVWSKTKTHLFFECSDSLESEESFRASLPDMGTTKADCRAFFERSLRSLGSASVECLAELPMEYRQETRLLFVVKRTGRTEPIRQTLNHHDALNV
jgi:SAM-dependent methyltransferase